MKNTIKGGSLIPKWARFILERNQANSGFCGQCSFAKSVKVQWCKYAIKWCYLWDYLQINGVNWWFEE